MNIWAPLKPGRYPMECYRSWINEAHNPALMHSILFSASVHYDAKRLAAGIIIHQKHTQEQLQQKGLGLKSIREALRTVSTYDNVSDDIILAILFLANNENTETICSREASPFAPPFTELDGLDVYGCCSYDPVHWSFICKVVEQWGGIHKMKLFGAAYSLSAFVLPALVKLL